MKLGKLLKKAVKLGGKIAKPLLAQTPVGAVALRAHQTLKSLGAPLKAAKLGKIQPLSVRAPVEKVAVMGPAKRLTVPKSIRRALSGRVKGSRMPTEAKTATPKGPKPKRPLSPSRLRAQAKSKALYAAWKAAGRPGKFFDWAKANR